MIGALSLFLAGLVVATLYMEWLGLRAYSNVQHTSELLAAASDVYGSLVDMETGMRGYVLTGDEQFLQPYNEASDRMPQLWARLESAQQALEAAAGEEAAPLAAQVAQVRRTAETWQRDWAESQITGRREGRFEEVASAVTTGRGREMFDAFRQASRLLDASSSELQARYTGELNGIRTGSAVISVALGLLALAGAVLTRRTAQREIKLQEDATQLIEREHRQLQTLIDNLPIAVRLVDAPESNVILQNRLAEEIFPADVWNSMNREQRIEYFDLRLADGTPIRLETAPIAGPLAEGRKVQDIELSTNRPETGTRNLQVSAAPIKENDGRVTGSVIIMQDVTEMKALDRRKDEFIAIAAHELRNPLAALVGYHHLATRTLAKAKMGGTDPLPLVERHLGEMSAQLDRLTRLIERLLDASRIQLGRIVLERSECDLVKVVQEAAANAQTTAGGAHEIIVQAPEQAVGEWDRTRIEQVVTNLLDNATRYSPPGSPVHIVVEVEEETVRVEVRDMGPGIPEAQRQHLFSRHYGPAPLPPPDPDADTPPPRKKRGLGLGLYVSGEIVAAHGGAIGMTPNPEGGSVFWFTLPLKSG